MPWLCNIHTGKHDQISVADQQVTNEQDIYAGSLESLGVLNTAIVEQTPAN